MFVCLFVFARIYDTHDHFLTNLIQMVALTFPCSSSMKYTLYYIQHQAIHILFLSLVLRALVCQLIFSPRICRWPLREVSRFQAPEMNGQHRGRYAEWFPAKPVKCLSTKHIFVSSQHTFLRAYAVVACTKLSAWIVRGWMFTHRADHVISSLHYNCRNVSASSIWAYRTSA